MKIEEYLKQDSLEIIVKANSPKNEITGYDDARKALKVNIKAPAENNKANIEIIKFFSKETGKKVKIISGLTNKKKIIRFF
jgi:uncharacterized protein